ncbi:hypothetical protein JAAARDRAFT_37227 [Jaapia argillacea MUCL 33604]|uniref:amidase n=1 Tax=Jaapia argillacea MUCL 33604 TaxID=933084 RepID=A0A067PZM8_9AGAM|nr:hypothetical protein JAAARDRAFT_37227 [Jaapia argillacea MUCL 33604]
MANLTSWQALVEDKRRRQKESIPKEWLELIIAPPPDVLNVTKVPKECKLLSAKELEITETSNVDVILQKLASSEWSSVEVTTAFYKRAIIAQQVVNCLTEIFVERALARAAELDAHLAKTGKVVGPLHGLPISLKDQLCVKGLETTMGYVSWIGKYADRNAVLVDILYECGAVPFVRTNIPQTLMWPETFNNVFGRTSNPYNRALTSGGSSGGEGALIALKGSPLGIGSDIGGSVRIPSAFCGLYGLRPSYNRVPYEGAVNSLEGQDSVVSVFGPMSNSLSGIKTFMKAVVGSKPWTKDPMAIRKKWDENEYSLVEHGGGKQLCFAFLTDDGLVTPHPPIIRALEMTKNALVADGHKVVDWVPLKHREIYENLAGIWGAGASEDYAVTTASTGEPILASMSFESDQVDEAPFLPSKGISAYELWQLHKRKRELRKEYLDHWEKTVDITGTGRPVDAIICPVAPYAAPPHGKNRSANFTMVWNGLDYPACVFPVTQVIETIDVKKPPHQFLSETDKTTYELYDPTTFNNAPVALQLVGRTLEEEAVIGMTEVVDAALRQMFMKYHKGSW